MVRTLEKSKTKRLRNSSKKLTFIDPLTGKENKTAEPRVLLPKISSINDEYDRLTSEKTECEDQDNDTTNSNPDDIVKNISSIENIVINDSERINTIRRKNPEDFVKNIPNIENIIISDSEGINTIRRKNPEDFVKNIPNIENVVISDSEGIIDPTRRKNNKVKMIGYSIENSNESIAENSKSADEVEISGLVGTYQRNKEDNCKSVIMRLRSTSKRSTLKRKVKAVVKEYKVEFCSQNKDVCTPKKTKLSSVRRNDEIVDENFDSDDESLTKQFGSQNKNSCANTEPVSSGELFKPTKSYTKSVNGKRRITRSSIKKLSFSDESPPRELNVDESPKTPQTPKPVKFSRNIFRSPRVNPNTITPTRSVRNTPYKTPSTPQNQARWSLMLSKAPDSLPCREKEFATIYKFICDKIRSKCGGFLCISGVPGTGKTATVERVLKKLRRDGTQKGLNKFETVEINGMELIKPQEVYRQIFKQLDGRVLSVKMAQELLNERFESRKKQKKRVPLILVIDEFDCLLNKKHDVVYKIVEWQIQDDSQLIVLAIANTLDFFEKKKIFSRLKYDMISFTAYTYQDLKEIVCDRLKGNNMFSVEAIELVARKVAAISGDARRVLNLCSQILEMTPEKDDQMITIVDVNKILEKIFSDPVIPQIRKLSDNLTRILRAIRDVLLRSGLLETSLQGGVWEQYKIICQLDGVTCRSLLHVCHSIRQLVADGLLKMDDKRMTYCTRFMLNTEPDMIKLALNGKK